MYHFHLLSINQDRLAQLVRAWCQYRHGREFEPHTGYFNYLTVHFKKSPFTSAKYPAAIPVMHFAKIANLRFLQKRMHSTSGKIAGGAHLEARTDSERRCPA